MNHVSNDVPGENLSHGVLPLPRARQQQLERRPELRARRAGGIFLHPSCLVPQRITRVTGNCRDIAAQAQIESKVQKRFTMV
jgi:hypothetical protein